MSMNLLPAHAHAGPTSARARSPLAAVVALVVACALVLPALPAAAADPLRDPATEPFATLDRHVVDKAEPARCHDPVTHADVEMADDGTCPTGTIPKVDQAYAWGMTQTGNDLWWGTIANVLCLVAEDLGFAGAAPRTRSWACTDPSSAEAAPADYTPPQIFQLNLTTGEVVDRTPPAGEDGLITRTLGLRSAGSVGDIVFLAGPTIGPGATVGSGSTVAMFAYRRGTGELLGEHEFTEYANIRSWVTVDGELFTGFTTTPTPTRGVTGPAAHGVIARWVGTLDDPFQFEIVGTTPAGSGVAELAEHEGRLYATTWPVLGAGPRHPAGLFMSPPISELLAPASGRAGSPPPWTEVWSITQYEQEPTVAAVTAGSALASFDGHLYWSTMHLPLSGLLAFLQAPANQGRDLEPEELLAAAVGTNRATTVWRGDGFEALDDAGGTTIQAAPTGPYCTAPDEADSDGAVCELLYGEHAVLAHRPTGPRVAGHVPSPDWGLVPTGWTPRYGRSGLGLWLEVGGTVPEPEPLGNPFNAYTWAMEVFQGQLFLGTFDWSYLLAAVLEAVGPDAELPTTEGPLPLAELARELEGHLERDARGLADPSALARTRYGADLWRFASSEERAVPESLAGVGNFLNYGVRTMAATDRTLFVGTANPMNIETDLTDERPEGGWEILALGTWPIPGPGPGPTPTRTLTLEPDEAELPVGDTHELTATLTRDGQPVADADITFVVTGTHDPTGVVATDDGGHAAFAYTGEQAGQDTIVAFLDTDGDGTPDPAELQASATATWTGAGVLPLTITRLAGDHRVATAIAISQAEFGDGAAGAVVLARADDFPDALAGTPLAVELDAPMLLTDPAELPQQVVDEIQRVLPAGRTVVLLGGEDAISAAVADTLTALGHTVERLAGATRYETALEIAHRLGDPRVVMLTNGEDFADALTAGVAAAVEGGAVLLTPGEERHPAVDTYLAAGDVTAYGIGGPGARPYPEATQLIGAERTATATLVAEAFFDAPAVAGLARADVFADALAGGPHIARAGGPMLLTAPDTLSAPTAAWLTANSGSLAALYLYGGEAALSSAVADAVQAATAG